MKKIKIDALSENISDRMESDIKNNIISGASVSVISPDDTLFKAHFGTLSAEDKTPPNNSTLFRMASMTKPVTAVAVMTLYDKGLLEIDDPVEKYLPQFKNMYIAEMIDGKAEKVRKAQTTLTIKHLLTHTSGLVSGSSGEFYANKLTDETNKTLKDTVDYYSGTGLGFEPYTENQYNATAAFDVLARIAEMISDMNYADFLKKYVTDPCEMYDTAFVPNNGQWERIIPMHKKENGKSGISEMKKGCVFGNVPVTHYLGGAGLISSLGDYTSFARMLLNKGVINGNRIISEKAVKLISTAQVPESIMPGNERWGLGVRVITSENYRFLPVGAFGWSGAYGTHFWIDPVNSIAAVYMKNSMFDGGSGAVTAANFEKDVFNSFAES